MYDVAALGELLIDFTCRSVDEDGYPTMVAHPGGAPANFLAALSKYGARTAMLGKVGDKADELLINYNDLTMRTGNEVRHEDNSGFTRTSPLCLQCPSVCGNSGGGGCASNWRLQFVRSD